MAYDDDKMIQQYQAELEAQRRAQQAAGNVPYAMSAFDNMPKQNLVEWQLDFRGELEDIERLLRSDVLKIDQKTNEEVWERNSDQTKILLNDVGVSDVIREVRMFLNKNKVLSNYGLEEIKPRIKMVGHEIRMLIYNNYEQYGIDNEYKMYNYPIMVITILSMIEDAYRRALNGEERRDLNQARVVNQTEPLMSGVMGGMGGYPMGGFSPQKKKSLFKPWTWFK